MIGEYLTAQRFEVETASNGNDAISLYDNFEPDIVLLSRELPMDDGKEGPDGLRVLKYIKHEKKQ